MADIEKVMKGLECCNESENDLCESCPYFNDFNGCALELRKDAMELLKEQEDGHWVVLECCANEGIYCSKCNNKIFDIATKPKKKLSNFCPNCGSKNTNFFNPSTGKIMYSD